MIDKINKRSTIWSMTMAKVDSKKLMEDLKYWREKWITATKERDPRTQRLETSSSMAMIDSFLDKYNDIRKSK